MKKLPILILVMFIALVAFTSCKKTSSNNNSNTSTSKDTISATGGVTFLETEAPYPTFGKSRTIQGLDIQVQCLIPGPGPDSTWPNFALQILNDSTVGTYSLNLLTSGSNISYQNTVDDYTTILNTDNPGTFTITSISNTGIAGTYTTAVVGLNTHDTLRFSGRFTGTYF
ncbi:MAG TPA: hypothetical protein VK705_04945 [Ferruginibacter sp.]|nr:hypothetical protein [Ferruginibacter sp.]